MKPISRQWSPTRPTSWRRWSARHTNRARTDFDSFSSIGGVTLDSADCTTVTTEGDSATVTCTGAINFTYNGEANSQDLSLNTYVTHKVDGNWTMCGYQ
ncbi:MAG: hypothetical protein U0703_11280 [Anaerolineae bacterium]